MNTIRSALFSAAFAVAGVFAATAGAQEVRELTVTEPTHSVDSVPFYVGLAKGFFKEEGLDITLVTSEGGGQHIAAVLTGDADAFLGGPEHIAFTKVKGGEPIKAVTGIAGKANLYFVARAGLEVDPKQPLAGIMKDRRILVGTRGGTGYSLLMQLLDQAGLDPRTDVAVIEVATASGRFAALRAEQGDIAMMQEPIITQGIRTNVLQEPFYSFPNDYGPFAWTTLNVPQKLIDAEPETVRKLVRALQRALAFTFENPQEVAGLVEVEFPTMSAEDREATLKRAYEAQMWQADGSMPEEAWVNLQKTVQDAGLLNQDVPFAGVFDLQFLQQ